MTSSCIIDDPPPYTQPKQTPPRLDLRRAVPLIDEIIVRPSLGVVNFNVPVVSEDAGDELVALLLIDYKGGPELARKASHVLEPSTLEQERLIDLTWNVEQAPGCHRVTLYVTHQGNLSYDPGPVDDTKDVAVAVWWANIAPSPDNIDTLVGCPLATEQK